MEFTTGISEFNTTYNLNAIDDYNKYLKGQASFEIEKNAFEEALDNAAKSYPVKDKADPTGLGNFASSLGNAFQTALMLSTMLILRLTKCRKTLLWVALQVFTML